MGHIIGLKLETKAAGGGKKAANMTGIYRNKPARNLYFGCASTFAGSWEEVPKKARCRRAGEKIGDPSVHTRLSRGQRTRAVSHRFRIVKQLRRIAAC